MSNSLALTPILPATPLAGEVDTILLASDLSVAAEQAFTHAALLAKAFGAHLTLYHVVETGPTPPAVRRSQEDLALRRAETAARRRLTAAAVAIRSPHAVAIERAVAAAEGVVKRIESTAPDLTVLATHGHHGVAELSLGGVAEAVVRQVGRPVLWVPSSATGAAYGYRRILVPTSLTLSSRRAFPLAARVAAIWQAEVLAMHVVAPPMPRSTVCCLPSEGAVRRFFEPEFAGQSLSARVAIGVPAYQVIQSARSEAVDLIVLSRPSPRGFAEAGIGSDYERIVRQAPCAVMVV
ncbi:MAG TPA: universal stress protein [Vicinamibacteria bacterium]|jgi:nucleotide-binding universal stress UspA family protein